MRLSLLFVGVACLGCEGLVDFDGLSGGASEKSACPANAQFCEGFENGTPEGTKGLFDDYDGNVDGNLVLVDPGPFNVEGNHVMEISAFNGDLTKVVAGGRKLYARWYVKWLRNAGMRAGIYGSDVQDVAGFDGERPTGGAPNFGSGGLFAALVRARVNVDEVELGAQYVGMYQDCPSGGPCNPDIFPCKADQGEAICTKPEHRKPSPPPNVEDGRWYCLEVAVDAGQPLESDEGANGSMDYALDGVHQGPFGGLWLRTVPDLTARVFWLTLSTSQAGPAILVDEFVISESPIGCP